MKTRLQLCFFIFFLVVKLYCQTVVYENESFGKINKDEFRLIDFFDYDVEGDRIETGEYIAKFKMNVYFDRQFTNTVVFKDDEGSINFPTNFRWRLESKQPVTIYFTVKHITWETGAGWMYRNLVLVETSGTLENRPWKKYISNDRKDINGWYLEDLGDGMYREHFFKNGVILEKNLEKNKKK